MSDAIEDTGGPKSGPGFKPSQRFTKVRRFWFSGDDWSLKS